MDEGASVALARLRDDAAFPALVAAAEKLTGIEGSEAPAARCDELLPPGRMVEVFGRRPGEVLRVPLNRLRSLLSVTTRRLPHAFVTSAASIRRRGIDGTRQFLVVRADRGQYARRAWKATGSPCSSMATMIGI